MYTGNYSIATLVLVGIALVGAYFIPSFVADHRDHHNEKAIFVLNLFLGWTGLGWVLSLVWAFTYAIPERERVARSSE